MCKIWHLNKNLDCYRNVSIYARASENWRLAEFQFKTVRNPVSFYLLETIFSSFFLSTEKLIKKIIAEKISHFSFV